MVSDDSGDVADTGTEDLRQRLIELEDECGNLRVFKTIADNSSEAIAISDSEGRLLYINHSHEMLFGRSLDEAKRLNYRDHYPPASIEILDREVAPALQRGESWEGRLEALDASGRCFLLWERADPIHDDEGNLLFAFGIMHDVAEEERKTKALLESEEHFRNLVEGSIQGVYVHDNFKPLFANQACADMFGYDSPDDILAVRSILDFVAPNERARAEQYGRSRLHGGEAPSRYEAHQGVRKDGSSFWMEQLVRVVKWQGKAAIQSTVIDITERKRAERALLESEQRFRDFGEAASDWFWEMDADLRFTYLSDRFFEIVGLQPEAVIGKTRGDMAGTAQIAEEPEKWRSHFDDLDAYRPIRDFEYAITGRDGETRHVLISGVPVFGKNGDFRGYRGTGTDATELIRANIALRDAKEHAEFANRAKTEFLANMSHELRTPLTIINGSSDIMVGEMFGPLDNPKYQEYARNIRDAGEHLLGLITDLLNISQIEMDKLELNESSVDIGQVAGSCHALIKGRVHDAGLTMEVETEENLPSLRADELRVKQVLLNLLSNAVKFTPAGGIVTLKAGIDEEGCHVLSAADTGVGIAPGDIDSVMASLGRTGDPLTREVQGAGIGLPLSKKLVELHGGTLELESEPGVGTTVIVRFPLERVVQ